MNSSRVLKKTTTTTFLTIKINNEVLRINFLLRKEFVYQTNTQARLQKKIGMFEEKENFRQSYHVEK